jgi:hypothetical protein
MKLLRKSNHVRREWAVGLALLAGSVLGVASVSVAAFPLRVRQRGNAAEDTQQFAGTWAAVHDGTRFVVLELHSERGALSGAIRVCSFNQDMERGSNNITITNDKLTESVPMRNLVISGKSLSFDWKDPDGDENRWKLELTGTDIGSLQWVGLPDGMKAAPIQVTRDGARKP